MRRARTVRTLGLLAIAALLVAVAGSANAAQVRVGTLVLTADGGFEPRVLPRRAYAPIRFQGRAEIRTTDGSVPPAVQRIRLEFDRDGRLTTAGLPSCPPQQIEGATVEQARAACGSAIVATGHAGAAIIVPGQQRVDVRSPLTAFNGPRIDGNATLVAHAETSFPARQTYVVVIPIERRSGTYRYRVTIDVPPIAAGYGALTHIDGTIGRRYRAGGAERSYISARCSDGILQTQGLVSFADGSVVSGSLFKPCRARP